ncbi:MAG: diguanylate cyclase [Frankiales bacterium]|jgi:diguanylate cyclase (GGDEF)-like protein|nr:diguanylate cyclase [Frankiales bacterium]
MSFGHRAARLKRHLRRPRSVEDHAIVALLTVCASAASLSALFPMTPQAPVRLNAALAVIGFGLAGACWLSNWRGLPHIALITTIAGLAVLTASAATPAGTAALGMSFTWTAAYAAFFFSRSAARAYAVSATAAFGVGVTVNPFLGMLHVWLLTTLTSLVAVEAIASLVGRLRRAALRDPLTDLLNRAGLHRQGERALRSATKTGAPLTVVVLDLDGFKAVNDDQGHAAGDRLLVALARAWEGEMRATDILARLGGDEFVLLLPDTDVHGAAMLLQRLAHRSPATWSAGTATHEAGSSLQRLLSEADSDLYRVKAAREVVPRR